jgi:hypothetical protein
MAQKQNEGTGKVESALGDWSAFERAVDAVVKAPPQHRITTDKKPKSFVEAVESLGLLLRKPGCPSECVDSASRLLKRLDKCLFVKPEVSLAAVAPEPSVILQPSDLFLSYLAAFRACDWPRVRVIEHEATLS